MSDQIRSICLLCTDANRVQRVLYNPTNLSVAPGAAFIDLFHPGSRQKALLLVQTIRDRQAAFGWELHVGPHDQATLMRFVGARVPEGVLFVGAEDQAYANTLFGRALQDMALAPPPPDPAASSGQGVELYEQVAGLNNQLVTMQRDLEKKHAEMSRLLEARAVLAAMAAHDLRTPLQVISTSATLLGPILETHSSGQGTHLLAMIRRNTDVMLALVNDLLRAYSADIGNLELSMQPIDLEQLARSNAENHRPLARQKQIALALDTGPRVPRVLGDPMRLDQLLNNLVHNAIKFSPANSTIRIGLSEASGGALLEVSDEGTGMEPDEFQALLHGTPGQSHAGTRSEQGYGLGFQIIRILVEKHGGKLGGESFPGKGTRFSIRLPAYAECGQHG